MANRLTALNRGGSEAEPEGSPCLASVDVERTAAFTWTGFASVWTRFVQLTEFLCRRARRCRIRGAEQGGRGVKRPHARLRRCVGASTRRLRQRTAGRPEPSPRSSQSRRLRSADGLAECTQRHEGAVSVPGASSRRSFAHRTPETRGSLRFPVYPCALATFPNSADVAGAVLVAPRPFRLRRLATARPSEVVISKPTRAARVLACLRIALALPLPARGWLPAGWTALAGRDSHPLDTQQFSEVRLRNLLVPYWDILITPEYHHAR